MIAVPVFVVVLALTRLLVGGLGRIRIGSLVPLLLLQFLLLSALLAVCVGSGPDIDPNAASMVFAGMLGVSAMAVQNALVRISLKGAPSTVVMTTNVTVFTIDVAEIFLRRDTRGAATARDRAEHMWPAIAECIRELSAEEIGRRVASIPAAKRVRLTALGRRKFDEVVLLWRTAQDGFEAAFGQQKLPNSDRR